MHKLVKAAAAAIAMAILVGSAYADDSSMSRWTGDSYKAFEAARNGSGAAAHRMQPGANPDNGMSRWSGDSYTAFEAIRVSPTTLSVADARAARPTPSKDVPARGTNRGRTSTNPFRDDTGA